MRQDPVTFSITFRPLASNDLTLLHEWLNRDFVAQWYHQPDLSLEGIRAKYLPFVTGADTRTRHFITRAGEKPIGMIHWSMEQAGIL